MILRSTLSLLIFYTALTSYLLYLKVIVPLSIILCAIAILLLISSTVVITASTIFLFAFASTYVAWVATADGQVLQTVATHAINYPSKPK